MVQINFALKEVSCKIVYYGPGLSGKTTNLQMVHRKMPAENKGNLTSIATEGERTLFFDFMPLDLGSVAGMRTKFQLYTVPGQVYYNATRKLVLKGVDGVVFVADSKPEKMGENLQSWQNLQDNLAEHGLTLEDVPVVFQYNKRDLPDAVPVELMNDRLNTIEAPWFEAVAVEGEGVLPTLKAIAELVLDRLNERSAVHSTASTSRAAGDEAGVDSRQTSFVPAAGAPAAPLPPRASDEPAEPAAASVPATHATPEAEVLERDTRETARGGQFTEMVASARARMKPATLPPAGDARGEKEKERTRDRDRFIHAAGSAQPLLEEAIGSGTVGGRAVRAGRGRAWAAVAVGLVAAFSAAAAVYFLWLRG